MSAKLVVRRTTLKTRISRALTFSKAIPEDCTHLLLKVKLDDLDSNFEKCSEIHMQILELTGDAAVDLEEIEFEAIQTHYETAKSRMLERFQQLEAANRPAVSAETEAPEPRRTEIKLPFLKIAPFNGDYSCWKSFRDLFLSAVGDRRDLSGAQKLHYLKSFLEGDAANLVRPYSVCDGNYRVAWIALDARYNNKRLLVNAHFKRLFGQPAITVRSAVKLRELLDTTAECVSALQALDLPTDHWDAILVYMVVQRLDAESHEQWEISLKENEIPTYAELASFMEKRCRSLEAIAGASANTIKSAASASSSRTSAHNSASSRASVHHASGDNCALCDQNHGLHKCRRFQAMAVAERRDVVQSKRLCYICMRSGHVSADCRSTRCEKCSGRHHVLLHIGSSTAAAESAPTGVAQTNFVVGARNVQVLLSTAYVTINDSSERIRVLVDQGSHTSLVRESCVQRLRLSRKRISVPIHGIGGIDAGTATSMVQIKVRSCVDKALAFDVSAIVMRSLTGMLPSKQVSFASRPKFTGLQLADPKFYEPGDVDMILGADVYGLLLLDGVITGSIEAGRERPTAQNTALGWILSGAIASIGAGHCGVQQTNHATISLHVGVKFDLQKFWEVEEVNVGGSLHTQEEVACEEHFVATHTRDATGRYVVRLPFKTAPEKALGDSRAAAMSRLRHIQRRLSGQQELRAQYDSFMREYAELGHMRLAVRPAEGGCYYLPHHFVLKESSTTTRLRVVFDASCKSTSGQSLNDLQMVGPRLQDDLASLVLRFRRHAVALTADIAKMYRQVAVAEADWGWQRILWFGDDENEVKEWELTTVTYGMAASPYLAVRALQQLARDEQQQFPRAASVIWSDFYVDDLITGCDSSEEAVQLHRELCNLMSRGEFELRKWSSNCEVTLDTIPDELRGSTQPLHLDEDASVKTLGLLWHPATDCFSFKVTTPNIEDRVTKRSILSVVARLFDPLGLLSPAIIVAKILLQRLWTSGITWEDDVPEPVRSTWLRYHESLAVLESLRFHRWIGARKGGRIELHGFADASEIAYGCVIYARCQLSDGRHMVSLLMAKSKVAPLKQLSLPRLELCAAALLAKLFAVVKQTFRIDSADYVLWTDSQVALAWIRKEPRCWKTFVANRVASIQTTTTPDRWRHVRSADNPADCVSRGMMPVNLVEHTLWMQGPAWLAEDESVWPNAEERKETDIDRRAAETMIMVVPESTCDNLGIMLRYSSLSKLQRITALLLRFPHNCRVQAAKRKGSGRSTGAEDERRTGFLTAAELRSGRLVWIRQVQATSYAIELRCCRLATDLPMSSKLLSLKPFVDEEGVLRVGGRIRNAAVTRDAAHPVILPGDSHLTGLIIDNAHQSLLHGGAQLMLTHLRLRYWVIGAKAQVRQHVHRCITCYRQRPRCAVQQMGDLPATRVTPGRAFLRSGVDYAGPIAYKSRAGRGAKTEKGYIALFVCLATKAVHLEFVTDLSADAFIAAFRRFVARRGRCAEMMSDNATNFVGAKRKLNEIILSQQTNQDISRILASDGTDWRTIPPRSPHFGGLWEAGVKAVKHHLRRVIGTQLLTYEEFSTVLAEIEAVLNSRPLCGLSSDVDDLGALTPGHFLVGESLSIVPDGDVSDVVVNRLSRWQLLSQMTQQFWRRWQREYLSTLQQRYKWATPADNMRIGQLVLMKDESLPPAKWRMARIIEAQPGDDGRVRVVKLRHAMGETTRAVAKVCLLPVDC